MKFEPDDSPMATACPTCRWIAEQVPGAVTAMDAFEGAVRSRDARVAALEAERDRLREALVKVLHCGLNEEPHGVGFTPSRQEKLAQATEQIVRAALAEEKP